MKTDGGLGALSRVAADALPGLRTAQTVALLSVAQAGTRELTLANLVEGAAVGEVLFLRFRPAAELLIDGKQLQFRELVSIFLRHIRIARAVEVLRRNLLAFRRVEILRYASATWRVPFLSTTLSTTETVGSARIELTRGHDFKLVFAQFVGRQQRFVFPVRSVRRRYRVLRRYWSNRARRSPALPRFYDSALTNSWAFAWSP